MAVTLEVTGPLTLRKAAEALAPVIGLPIELLVGDLGDLTIDEARAVVNTRAARALKVDCPAVIEEVAHEAVERHGLQLHPEDDR